MIRLCNATALCLTKPHICIYNEYTLIFILMKTLLQLRTEVKDDLLKSVATSWNTYKNDFIDERINATISNICGGTVINPANPREFISKTNLRFLEKSLTYGCAKPSVLQANAEIGSNFLAVGNPIVYSDTNQKYWYLNNKVTNLAADYTLSADFWETPLVTNTPWQVNHSQIAQIFKPTKKRLKSFSVFKQGSSTTIDYITVVEVFTNNNGVPWDLLFRDELDKTLYNTWAGTQIKVNCDLTLDMSKFYFIKLSLSGVPASYPSQAPLLQMKQVTNPSWFSSGDYRYDIPWFNRQTPLHLRMWTGFYWDIYRPTGSVVSPWFYTYYQLRVDFEYVNSVWIDGNMIDYVDFNNVSRDVNFINYPHQAGRLIHYVYELPSDYWFMTKVTYDNRYELKWIDYRKLYQVTNPSEPRMYQNSNQVYSNIGNNMASLPFYTLYRDWEMLIMNGNGWTNVMVEYQMKHPYLESDSDTTLIPDSYAGAISYLAASDILALRWEPDKAAQLWMKWYAFAQALVKQEWYKTKELQFNSRVGSVSDSWLNI